MRVAQNTKTTIAEPGGSSQELGNVFKVINRIAEQTNMPAFNATIEASRAVEAGKSFVVVANGVKEPARQTADATEENSQKITIMQEDTKQATEVINEITNVIDRDSDFSTAIASAVEEQTATTA